jgi:uncharacterized oligopeptide transporter (OPT) family protein
MTSSSPEATGLKRFLPRIGSPGYHILLASVAILILGPLGGISAAFMNFSIGFFVGGQVLAGILGSSVTLPYGPEGKHGANYIQTMAASVAGMCGMGVLLQAMVWLGLPQPPIWKTVLYFMCIGMFGVGVGMLYTPILVDRMQLTFPSGFAVANILRALTDKNLLRRSIAQLGSGIFVGYLTGYALASEKFMEKVKNGWQWLFEHVPGASVDRATANTMGLISAFSAATFGAGMIVGARIAVPALVVGVAGELLKEHLVSIGWLDAGQPFRKIGFIIALGTIMGAAIVDITLILIQAVQRLRQPQVAAEQPTEDWKKVNTWRLVAWVIFWGAGVVIIGSQVLHQPILFLLIAVGLCFLFVLVNGISLGISDSNPISSAFVLTVFILAAVGLKDPAVGLMCASIMLIACSEGGDMQQDRSTGWRLGTNRIVQFRYQVIGIAMGAVLAVLLAKLFMGAYPILTVNQITSPDTPGVEKWQSAMTYKFVGALKDITNPKPHVMKALALGVAIGLVTEILRKLLKQWRGYQTFSKASRTGRFTDFILDVFIVPSPYASSFGGFVSWQTSLWWSLGGVIATVYDVFQGKRRAKNPRPTENALPEDMSTTSLVGGGIIAGDALAALTVGITLPISSGALKKLFGG